MQLANAHRIDPTWDRWRSKNKSEIRTFTIVTTEPSKFAAQFHNRMPVVLEQNSWDLGDEGRARSRSRVDEAGE
jgi:hypothetical protein